MEFCLCVLVGVTWGNSCLLQTFALKRPNTFLVERQRSLSWDEHIIGCRWNSHILQIFLVIKNLLSGLVDPWALPASWFLSLASFTADYRMFSRAWSWCGIPNSSSSVLGISWSPNLLDNREGDGGKGWHRHRGSLAREKGKRPGPLPLSSSVVISERVRND